MFGSAFSHLYEECAQIRYLLFNPVAASLFVMFFLAIRSAPAQQIVYVNQHATGPAHDGTTWCSAFPDLQDALGPAVAGTEIHVAGGTYRPTAGTNRRATFELKTGVVIRGGFAGCGAPDPDLRDWVQFESILSGDLLGDDDQDPSSTCCSASGAPGCDDASCQSVVMLERASCASQWDTICAVWARILCPHVCGNRSENSYHVVTSLGADDTALVDGFVIQDGQADSFDEPFAERGAGILNYFVPSAPTFSNCVVRRNVAAGKGGGAYNNETSVTYKNCLFIGNVAKDGGAMANFSRNGNPVLLGCTMTGNVAAVNHGGIWNANSDSNDVITLKNTLLWGNEDAGGVDESAQFSLSAAKSVIAYTTIQGWTGVFGGIGNNGFDPFFVNAQGPDGIFGTSDDDVSLSPGSPAINTGDPASVVSPGDADLVGNARLIGCRMDHGAIESAVAQVLFDFDADGVIGLADYAGLQTCYAATSANPFFLSACLCMFDADGSEVLDLVDYDAFHAALMSR